MTLAHAGLRRRSSRGLSQHTAALLGHRMKLCQCQMEPLLVEDCQILKKRIISKS